MGLDKEALKARLLERYAVQVDEMLEQLADDAYPQLSEIEEMALKLRQAVGQSATEEIAVNTSQKQPVNVACPTCQESMRYKGHKSKWMKTRTGDVQIERAYYYCEQCGTGHFPPG